MALDVTVPSADEAVAIDDCGAGGVVQVLKLGTSAAGTVALAPVDATAGVKVDLGADNDVTVTGAALTALQLIDDPVVTLGTDVYTEATSKGVVIGGVRRDADTSLANTTNEFAPFQLDANGRLKVEAFSGETLPVSLSSVPSHAVTNAGTFPVQIDGAALTALQLIDDPVVVLGTDVYTEATSKGTVIGAVRRDADTTLVGTTNEFGPLQMDANGRLKVEAFSGEALPITDNGSSVTVDATEAAPLPVRSLTVRVPVTSSGFAAAVYTAGDQMGALFTIANAARASGGSGRITGVKLVDASNTLGVVDVVFFDSTVTLASDNAVYAISDADALKEVFAVSLGGPYLGTNNRSLQAHSLAAPFVCNGGTSLFAAVVCRATTASGPASTDVTLIVYIEN